MSAESVLFTTLGDDPDIAAAVGTRIYPVMVPVGLGLPAIAYRRSNTEYTNTIGNAAIASKVTFDVYCVAELFGDAEALCDLVSALDYEKLNRVQDYDSETECFAAVITLTVWPE